MTARGGPRGSLLTQSGIVCRARYLDDESIDESVHVELVGLDSLAASICADRTTLSCSGVAEMDREPLTFDHHPAQLPLVVGEYRACGQDVVYVFTP